MTESSTSSRPSKKNRLPHIGARNIKTSLSVFLCLLIYSVIQRDGVLLACTSAIICMQSNLEKSFTSGRDRLIGTACGALLGMGLLYLKEFIPIFDATPVITTLGVMIYILFCNMIHKQDAIVIGCVVVLMIVLGETDQTPFIYSINRLIDTFVGILLSIAVNRFIRNPEEHDHVPAAAVQDASDPPPTQADSQDTPLPAEEIPTQADLRDASNPAEEPPAQADSQDTPLSAEETPTQADLRDASNPEEEPPASSL